MSSKRPLTKVAQILYIKQCWLHIENYIRHPPLEIKNLAFSMTCLWHPYLDVDQTELSKHCNHLKNVEEGFRAVFNLYGLFNKCLKSRLLDRSSNPNSWIYTKWTFYLKMDFSIDYTFHHIFIDFSDIANQCPIVGLLCAITMYHNIIRAITNNVVIIMLRATKTFIFMDCSVLLLL